MGDRISISKNTSEIIRLSNELGFDACGISKAEPVGDDFTYFQQWLQKGYYADMHWITQNTDKREDPRLLVDNAKSVISFIINYYQPYYPDKSKPRIAKYALGKDYHKVLKKKLKTIVNYLQANFEGSTSRAFVDSAPVLEHAWAKKAGLGWIGKHSLLINRKIGSYFFIAEIITSVELDQTHHEEKDFCGSCERCINACPTQAIKRNRTVDANLCISYHTIENKEELPAASQTDFQNWIFGCDICQDVCPYNKKPIPTSELKFIGSEDVINLNKETLESLTPTTFDKMFEGSAVRRTKFKGLKRNYTFIKDNLDS